MSLLNQNNKKGKKKGDKKNQAGPGGSSKFIPKQSTSTSAGFKSRQKNTGSQRGS
jgi:hypothetical protein